MRWVPPILRGLHMVVDVGGGHGVLWQRFSARTRRCVGVDRLAASRRGHRALLESAGVTERCETVDWTSSSLCHPVVTSISWPDSP